MSDDLVKRLSQASYLAFADGTNDHGAPSEAAARIAELEAAEVARGMGDAPRWVYIGLRGVNQFRADKNDRMYICADFHAARIAELEAANRGLVRLNEATVARAEAAEAQVENLVEALEEIASHDTGATAGIAYTASAALSTVKQKGGE